MFRYLFLTSLFFIFIPTASALSPKPSKYTELRLGEIKPQGWLRETLNRQKDGISANLDETYSQVCGPSNGWLGGDGDQWERGPYWIDGLLPMAYILDDLELKAKVKKWVEWSFESQSDDGQFGPRTDYAPKKGIQRTKALDWWPRMVMLKIMQQYYNATQDKRVLLFLNRYFRYQLKTLSEKPLDYWSKWAPFRCGDNMLVALWLYSITKEDYLLELCHLLHTQSFGFVPFFLGDDLSRQGSIHCVNLAQGLKEPTVYYLASGDDSLLDATQEGLRKLRQWNGFPNGMFGADETLHGNCPTQGSELCSAVELMYSYEEMLKITGNTSYAEELERVAFNALPAQISDDFTLHQYFQQSNQIHISAGGHNFDVFNSGTSLVFGFLTGYPCCLCNLHQGWPKFTQNLWYRYKNGFAAMVYAPCQFSAPIEDASCQGQDFLWMKLQTILSVIW
ncbi:MAG: glycoside hydrolase family 127 protein [Alistipes sp.]|nr:glycoside hydrolase family 127 protein [Candidatus Alistipes equi]